MHVEPSFGELFSKLARVLSTFLVLLEKNTLTCAREGSDLFDFGPVRPIYPVSWRCFQWFIQQ